MPRHSSAARTARATPGSPFSYPRSMVRHIFLHPSRVPVGKCDIGAADARAVLVGRSRIDSDPRQSPLWIKAVGRLRLHFYLGTEGFLTSWLKSVRGLLRPDGLVPWQRPALASVRFAPGRAAPRRAPNGRDQAAHGPATNGSTACRMRFAYRLRSFAPAAASPLRRHARADAYLGPSASPRSPCLAGENSMPCSTTASLEAVLNKA
jgi:hypothetical protein